MLYLKFEVNRYNRCRVTPPKAKACVTCHAPIGILCRGMAEKLKSLKILEQPYLRNHLTDFYGTKTKI